jgi:hypothetical protein
VRDHTVPMTIENQMNTEMTENFHIVMEMTLKPDCRLVGSWLLKVAEAEGFLSQTRSDPAFATLISEMGVSGPDIQAAALEAVSALQHDTEWPFHAYNPSFALVVDLGDESGDFGSEVAILVQLGFFTLVGGRYQMSVPESVTLEGVQQAVLKVASTQEDHTGAQPQRMLHTMPKAEAEAMALHLRNAA